MLKRISYFKLTYNVQTPLRKQFVHKLVLQVYIYIYIYIYTYYFFLYIYSAGVAGPHLHPPTLFLPVGGGGWVVDGGWWAAGEC